MKIPTSFLALPITVALYVASPAFVQAKPPLRPAVEKRAITTPDWQKPFAVAVSADGRTAEVLAWRGEQGLHRYTWKYPASKLIHVGKVSAGYNSTGNRAESVVTAELNGLKAAMGKRLGLRAAAEAKRAALLKDWQAQNAGSTEVEGRTYARYFAKAISLDGTMAIGTDGDGCWVWHRGKGFISLNKALSLDNMKHSYQSYFGLSPDGKTLWWVDESAVVWVHDGKRLSFAAPTQITVSSGSSSSSNANRQKTAGIPRLASCFGKDFDVYEQILGKPGFTSPTGKVTGADGRWHYEDERRYYKASGLKRIELLKLFKTKDKGNGEVEEIGLGPTVTGITYHFAPGKTKSQKDALSLAGLPTKPVSAGVYGVGGAKFTVLWTKAGAEYPWGGERNTTGSDLLNVNLKTTP